MSAAANDPGDVICDYRVAVTTTPTRVYAARLAGLPVFDPQGDQVGKVRDVVVVLRRDVRQPRVVGLVIEVFGRRQIFAPMTGSPTSTPAR